MVEAAILNDDDQPDLNLLVLASKPPGLSPSQRFRLEQWAPYLRRNHGITLHFRPFESAALAEILQTPGHLARKAGLVLRDFVRRFDVLGEVGDYDAVVIHREAALIGPAIIERMIAASRKPLIFDFDDSIWSPAQEMANGVFSKLHFFGKTASICRLATAVTVGNAFLARYAREYTDRVEVIPTSIDLGLYPLVAEPVTDSPFVVCWTGSASTLVHFDHARPALEKLARQLALQVNIICNVPPTTVIEGAQQRYIPWSAEGEAQTLGNCHAGIMPLPDNEATRGKCGLKALQYMATGRPVVVSPVGVNLDLVDDGRNGFLASTSDEWVAALTELARDRKLRARMGKAARATIEHGFSASVTAARFARLVRKACRKTV